MINSFDIKQSLVNLYKDYTYSLMVILTLAMTLAIGIFLFAIVYSIEFKPLPEVEQSDRVAWGTLYTSGRPYAIGGLSNYNYRFLKEHQTTLNSFGRVEERSVTLSTEQFTEQLRGAAVSSQMFSVLGVEPTLGRVLQDQDDVPGAQQSVVLSYRVWESLYSKRENVVGETVTLDGQVSEVVGVMPSGFGWPIDHEVWFVDTSVELGVNDHGGWNSVYGRLKDGVSMEYANEEFKRLMVEMKAEFPNQYKGKDLEVIAFTQRFSGNQGFLLSLLKIATIAILIMGCFSVANLIIVRNLEKAKEALIKAALGVPVFRIVIGPVLENLWVCLIALVLGLWLSYLSIQMFGQSVLSGPYWWELNFESVFVVLSIVITLLFWVFTTVVPVFMASRQPTNRLLSSGRKGGTSNALSGVIFGLSAAQLFSAFVLCVFTGVLVAGLLKIANADYGVPRDGYLVAEVKLSGGSYEELENRSNYYKRFIERANNSQSIDAAGVINALPGTGGYLATYTSTERALEVSGGFPKANETPISLSYFELMEIDLISGRDFNEADVSGAQEVAIVNETMAEILFPDGSAVGKQFQYDPENNGELITIIGVAPDVVINNPLWYFSSASKDWRSQIYRPIAQKQPVWSANTLVFKVSGNPYDYISEVKAIAREVDSAIPLYQIKSYDEFLKRNEGGFRRMILTFAPAALLSLIIAALGLFTLTRRVTLQKMPDIGVMRALGLPEFIINLKFMIAPIYQWVMVIVLGTIFSMILLPKLPTRILMTTDLTTITTCLTVGIIIGGIVVLASYLPMLQARNMQPKDAMNYLSGDQE